jgi:hypothetical protein
MFCLEFSDFFSYQSYFLISNIMSKSCVTNPNAAGLFLVAGGFTGLPPIFPHRTGAVQN